MIDVTHYGAGPCLGISLLMELDTFDYYDRWNNNPKTLGS